MRVPRSIQAIAAVAALAMAGQAAAGQIVVRRGDTLSGLAKRAGVSIGALASANGIADIHRIREGQVLRMPGVPVAAPPAAAPGGGLARHLIARGETLAAIARKHGVTVAALAAANGITNPNRIIAGNELAIPAGSATPGKAPAAAPGAPAPVAVVHTVDGGETLSGIAKRYGVTVAAIVAANKIDNPNRVREGTKLTIPTGGGPTGDGTLGLPAKLVADPARLALMPIFDRWAAEYGLPPDLLKAMAWLESGWQNHVRSSVGAMGIGQLMPATVDFVCDRLLKERLDPNDPEHNIRMSARYLKWLLDQAGGDPVRALAGYYQGPASVRDRGMLTQTRAYVDGVMSLRARF